MDEARGPSGGREELPLACSLGSDGMQTRRDEWSGLLAANLLESVAIPGGVRLVLRPSRDTTDSIEHLVSLENSCCPWIDWTIQEGRYLQVDATAENEGGATMLREWFGASSPTG